jgi:hypothetical protein
MRVSDVVNLDNIASSPSFPHQFHSTGLAARYFISKKLGWEIPPESLFGI